MKRPTKAAIARAIGVSPPAFTKYVKRGCPIYSIEAAAAWQAANVDPTQRLLRAGPPAVPPAPAAPDMEDAVSVRLAGEGDGDLLSQRTRLAAAQAEQIEMRNALMRREYAPVALLEEALAQTSRLMARVLERLPAELRRKRPHLTQEDLEIVAATVAEVRNLAYRAVLAEIDPTSTVSAPP
jgi:phage terminase Nu1 subunit (DNA packaging protein)